MHNGPGWTLRRRQASLARELSGVAMDNDDDRELVRRLFVKAVELIETAHETAVAGQTAGLSMDDYAVAARQLGALVGGIAALSEAALVITGSPINDRASAVEETS